MKLIRIGLAGFGNVGEAVYRHLTRDADLLARRCGARFKVTALAVRNPRRKRTVPLPRHLPITDPESLAKRPDVDVVVELMGGCGAARQLILASLKEGKPVVTANKALLAEHGHEIFGEASQRGVPLYFEASVAGGIPIIRALREGLIANRFELIYGIANGTCNYILTRMSENGLSFGEALAEAQAKGYAEADPSLDIDGLDSAHKAAVLASLAYHGCVDFKQVYVEGIRHVTQADVEFAHQLGYVIKLLVIIRPSEGMRSSPNGFPVIEVRVHPTLIPCKNRLASIRGVTNAIMVRGHVTGDIEFSGPGAGGDATAGAILSDLADLASVALAKEEAAVNKSAPRPAFRIPHSAIRTKGPQIAKINGVISRYYLRLSVVDRPGVMAQVSSVLARSGIGISSIIQPEGHEGKSVPLILMIHDSPNDAMATAIRRIQHLRCVKGKPVMLRVETFEK